MDQGEWEPHQTDRGRPCEGTDFPWRWLQMDSFTGIVTFAWWCQRSVRGSEHSAWSNMFWGRGYLHQQWPGRYTWRHYLPRPVPEHRKEEEERVWRLVQGWSIDLASWEEAVYLDVHCFSSSRIWLEVSRVSRTWWEAQPSSAVTRVSKVQVRELQWGAGLGPSEEIHGGLVLSGSSSRWEKIRNVSLVNPRQVFEETRRIQDSVQLNRYITKSQRQLTGLDVSMSTEVQM